MRIKLWHRLALLLALVGAVVLLVALYFSQQSFKRGFLEYLNSQEGERIEYVIEQLRADYILIGGWSFVVGPPEKWQQYLRAIFEKANQEGLFPEIRPERKAPKNQAGLYRTDSADKRFRLPPLREVPPGSLLTRDQVPPPAQKPPLRPQPQQAQPRQLPPPQQLDSRPRLRQGDFPPPPPQGIRPDQFPPGHRPPPRQGFPPPHHQMPGPGAFNIPGISAVYAGSVELKSEIPGYELVPTSAQTKAAGQVRNSASDSTSKPAPASRPRPLLQVALEDQQGNLIAGAMDKNSSVSRWPIVVNNRPVGYLVVKNVEQFANHAEQEFIGQQSRVFSLIAVSSIVLISLLAWWLGRLFNARIMPLSEMAHQLTDGDFDRRVTLSSDDELGQLASDLNQLALTLEQNRDSRQRWIADISHELRTPISILRGELEALLDGVRPLRREAIESLQTEVLRLTQLVDDLYQLTMADVGALSYQFEQLNLLEVLKQELGAFKRQFKAQAIRIRLNSKVGRSVYVNGDRTRLGQLFKNLIQNTLRYTDAPGELVIHISSVQSGAGSGILLSWSDSAPGVADDLYSRLFERMLRAEESRNRETGGAGLGLAIVEQIVAAHQAKVKASPSSLGGLSIDIVFPQGDSFI